MKSWRVVTTHFPYLPISFQVRRSSENVEALLDTGFSGDVIVPHIFIANGKTPDSHVNLQIADGSVVSAPAYLGTVQIGKRKLSPIVIIGLGNEPIVGCNFARYFTITLDHGRRLIIEP